MCVREIESKRVCVCEGDAEREREREKQNKKTKLSPKIFLSSFLSLVDGVEVLTSDNGIKPLRTKKIYEQTKK